MLSFYYTTFYHDDGFLVGQVWFIWNGIVTKWKQVSSWDPDVVHKNCQTIVTQMETI